MSSEMIERVARAIFNTGFHPDDVLNGNAGKKWHEWPDEAAKAIRKARAAIEAMREPTRDMAKAGDTSQDGETDTLYFSGEDAWKRMIDAALKEPEKV